MTKVIGVVMDLSPMTNMVTRWTNMETEEKELVCSNCGHKYKSECYTAEVDEGTYYYCPDCNKQIGFEDDRATTGGLI